MGRGEGVCFASLPRFRAFSATMLARIREMPIEAALAAISINAKCEFHLPARKGERAAAAGTFAQIAATTRF